MFERWCLEWLRVHRANEATRFGPWWGNAVNELRRNGTRTTEGIDAVGSLRGWVTLVAEAKWTGSKLTPAIVRDLDAYKIPALRQSGLRVVNRPRIVLFSKAGYTDALRELAAHDDRLLLVDVASELGQQMTGG